MVLEPRVIGATHRHEIMDLSTIATISGVAVSILAPSVWWALRVERKLAQQRAQIGERLSFRQHESICATNQEKLQDLLEAINKKLDRAEESRHQMRNITQRLVTRIALIQQRLGLPINEEG